MSIRDVAHESDSWWAYKPAPSRRPLGQDPAFRYSMLGQNRPIPESVVGLLPRDESVVPEPSCFEVIASTKKSPAFEEEMMRLKRRQVAAQSLSGARVDPRPLRQQVAADGQYLVTKLLGGGPPSPTDGPKPRRGRSMTRLHPPLGEPSVSLPQSEPCEEPRLTTQGLSPCATGPLPLRAACGHRRSARTQSVRLADEAGSASVVPSRFLHAQFTVYGIVLWLMLCLCPLCPGFGLRE